MQDYRGVLRRPNFESALNTPSKELFDSDFQQDQRQKYERSEHSYVGSRAPILESKQALHRSDKEIFDDNIPVKVKMEGREEHSTYLRMQLLLMPEKGGSVLRLNLTDDSNQYIACYP